MGPRGTFTWVPGGPRGHLQNERSMPSTTPWVGDDARSQADLCTAVPLSTLAAYQRRAPIVFHDYIASSMVLSQQ